MNYQTTQNKIILTNKYLNNFILHNDNIVIKIFKIKHCNKLIFHWSFVLNFLNPQFQNFSTENSTKRGIIRRWTAKTLDGCHYCICGHHCFCCSCQRAHDSWHARTLFLAARYEAVVPANVDTAKCVRFTAGNRTLTICCVMCTKANVNVNTPSPVPYDLVMQSKYEPNPGRSFSKCSLSNRSLVLFMAVDKRCRLQQDGRP